MTNNPNSSTFSGIEISPENSYFRSNWADPNDPFESVLSSIVSSPASGPGFISGDGIMIKELIGRLGSIYKSGPISPQSCIAINGNYDFAERAANFSSFGVQMGIRNRSGMNSQFDGNYGVCEKKFSNENGELMADSREGSSVSEIGGKTQNDVNCEKRKSIPKAKINESSFPSSFVNDHKGDEKEVSNTKRRKTEKKKMSSENSNNKVSEKAEPSKDYIHVRARRGQATDSHSLAERVRREKISDRMKFLQDLVPGCNKVTGKATVLDEIINYVQSLQQQVEFLSMKLANVNPRMDFNMEVPFSDDMFEVSGSPRTMYGLDQNSPQSFPFGSQQTLPTWVNGIPNGSEFPFSLNPLNSTGMHRNTIQLASMAEFCDPLTQVTNFWGDDLQSIVQMGTLSNAQMKVEL